MAPPNKALYGGDFSFAKNTKDHKKLGKSDDQSKSSSSVAAAIASEEKVETTQGTVSLLSQEESSPLVSVSFSHVHLYVDSVADLKSYKQLENDLNLFAEAYLSEEEEQAHSSCGKRDTVLKDQCFRSHREKSQHGSLSLDVKNGRKLWKSIITERKRRLAKNRDEIGDYDDKYDADNDDDDERFSSENRDVVRQLLAGFGFRVTGARMRGACSSNSCCWQDCHNNDQSCAAGGTDNDEVEIVANTRSVLVTSPDPSGVQIVITALDPQVEEAAVGRTRRETTETVSHSGSYEDGKKEVEEADDDVNKHSDISRTKNEKEVMETIIDEYRHFDAANLRHFFRKHSNRQGIAVLAFEVTFGSIETILKRYEVMHPRLIKKVEREEGESTMGAANNDIMQYVEEKVNSQGRRTGGKITIKILEVYAYYRGEKEHTDAADKGTVLRFLQSTTTDSDDSLHDQCSSSSSFNLPGLIPIQASFDKMSLSTQSAYYDHWVSNVMSRTSFLDTLRDVLGFVPKVDFNAGVVAAGEAQIESTVTGNSPLGWGGGGEGGEPIKGNDDIKDNEKIELPGTAGNDNDGRKMMSKLEGAALKDQSQVYLPINNALSPVGHVHGFIEELGQGIQHVASRVQDLTAFVQRANDYRKITGEGFTFLSIPRSYYGVLTPRYLMEAVRDRYHNEIGDKKDDIDDDHNKDTKGKDKDNSDNFVLSGKCASAIVEACIRSGIADGSNGSVDLTFPAPNEEDDNKDNDMQNVLEVYENIAERINKALVLPTEECQHIRDEFRQRKHEIVKAILHSRYVNLQKLLGNRLSGRSYLDIVRNQILVDLQGEDLLFQIFTCNILQRHENEEAPFFEFIQRVCASSTSSSSSSSSPPSSSSLSLDGIAKHKNKKNSIKPGCGGFGIRNFLTLFLSIEVSKAMKQVQEAKRKGDQEQLSYANAAVNIFTNQLNESNPILTDISNAMTLEGWALEQYNRVEGGKDDKSRQLIKYWQDKVQKYASDKQRGNLRLMECSAKYKEQMKCLREGRKEKQSTNS